MIRSINFGKELPINSKIIAKETKGDPFLQEIVQYMLSGWPESIEEYQKNIFANHQDLEIVDECLMFQDRVVIPQKMQSDILKLLHANHTGMVRMKQLARRTVYWFGINSDIEKYVRFCDACISMGVIPKLKIESNWIATTKPFSRIHIDFFYFAHNTFLLMVDSFSKWIEIELMSNGTNCGKVLRKLVAYFARFGLPDVPFNSHNFTDFLKKNKEFWY